MAARQYVHFYRGSQKEIESIIWEVNMNMLEDRMVSFYTKHCRCLRRLRLWQQVELVSKAIPEAIK